MKLEVAELHWESPEAGFQQLFVDRAGITSFSALPAATQESPNAKSILSPQLYKLPQAHPSFPFLPTVRLCSTGPTDAVEADV